MRMTSPSKIMLIACGSFSPPTPMHFRMFEIARDHFEQMGTAHVVGGIISPVHDSYGKNGLASATHRCNMIKIGLQSSDWIRLSEWETQQEEWTRTRMSLQYHQNSLNSYLKDSSIGNDQHIPSWIPEGLKKTAGHVQLKLLCGADLLESFATPGLWKDEDIEAIVGQHGIVVVSRAGSNPEQLIFNSDLLSRYRRNITIVTNWIINDVSSTLVRRLLNRGLSVKYLLDDYLIDYIKKNGLYGTNDTFIMASSDPQIMELTSDNLRAVDTVDNRSLYTGSQSVAAAARAAMSELLGSLHDIQPTSSAGTGDKHDSLLSKRVSDGRRARPKPESDDQHAQTNESVMVILRDIQATTRRNADAFEGIFAELRSISGAVAQLRQEVAILKESSARFPSESTKSTVRRVSNYDP